GVGVAGEGAGPGDDREDHEGEDQGDQDEDAPPSGVPDGFRYRITVGDRTVYCADPDLTGAQRTLVSRVLKEGA
ncbi:hypothetical protein ACFXA0_06560, partial [Streptomyces cyaneofuscatus]